MQTDIMTDMLQNRAFMYKLLSQIYKTEITKELFDKLKEIKFAPQEIDDELAAGYREFEAFFAKKQLNPITDLAVDYARVFLGAGVHDGSSAFPYESVYTSENHLVMQEARDEVVAIYASFGLNVDKKASDPEDHIAFELEFMAFLCDGAIDALGKKDREKTIHLLKSQQNFLNDHLLNWVENFCVDIRKFATSEFYIAVSKITNGFLQLDKSMCEYLLEAANS